MKLRKMRPIQVRALAYCLKQPHPFLIMQQRTGKCLVVLRRHRMFGPNAALLVVCPPSAVQGWVDECGKEFMKCTILEGTKKQREDRLNNADAQVYITIYQTAIIMPVLTRLPFMSVCLDESPEIKNPSSKRAKFFINNFKRTPHRFALAAEPAPERDTEYWPQLAWVNGGTAFGYDDFWKFRVKEFYPSGFDWVPTPEFKRKLTNVLELRCFTAKRADDGYIENVKRVSVPVHMKPEYMREYRAAEKSFAYAGKETVWATSKYIWLRYLASGINPINKEMLCADKFRALESILEDELPTVVVFAFNDELEKAAMRLEAPIVNGDTKKTVRRQLCADFQAGKFNSILCQAKCISMGLNLSRANRMVFFSLDPAHLTFIQVCDRLVDLSKADELSYLFLKTVGTVDEDIHNAMTNKGWRTARVNWDLKEQLRKRQCATVLSTQA